MSDIKIVKLGLQYNTSSLCVLYERFGTDSIRIHRIPVNFGSEDPDFEVVTGRLRQLHSKYIGDEAGVKHSQV